MVAQTREPSSEEAEAKSRKGKGDSIICAASGSKGSTDTKREKVDTKTSTELKPLYAPWDLWGQQVTCYEGRHHSAPFTTKS
eukprot:1712529-Amphidinium_carterae.2